MRAALVIALAILIPLAAVAAQRDKKAASGHFQRGRALYAEARYAEALESFRAGYEVYPLPGFLVNIGQCLRKLDRLEEAVEAWRKFIDSGPADGRLRTEVEEALAEVGTELKSRADADERRKRDGEQARRALIDSIAKQQQAEPAPAPRTAPSPAVRVSAPVAALEVRSQPHMEKKKSRWWVWTLVGVGVAGAVAAGVTVGVIEGRAAQPQPGSLGLIDGRR
jgi:tetratricopeptide (TPR) repeat protein